MGKCLVCGREANTISSSLSVCGECLRSLGEVPEPSKVRRARFRSSLGLPVSPPSAGGESGFRQCNICVNECQLRDGDIGFCGLWSNVGGLMKFRLGMDKALGLWYLDPHPTNCVAGPVCPANTSRGYPEYTKTPIVEVGYYNLAVFFGGCSLDCLFCQNYEHKELVSESIRGRNKRFFSIKELIERALSPEVTCVCFFGGDPGPHSPHAIAASREILRKSGNQVKRICWETNGLQNPAIMREMAKLSLESGGIVKIDWKAWSPVIYEALTGINGVKAIDRLKHNVRLISELRSFRREPPLLVVSTLLVPGYVDLREVEGIATYIASVDPDIPYILLAFHPTHLMRDLPTTSYDHAFKALKIARSLGLKEVYIGNEWLLSNAYST